MDISGERARKAALGRAVKAMKESPGYVAVMERVADRCGAGKWWKAWVLADEKQAEMLRVQARGYLSFDELVTQMIAEGENAQKILEDGSKGEAISPSSPRSRFSGEGQGE